MTKKTDMIKPVTTIAGIALLSSLAVSSVAQADENVFEMADLDQGYMLAGGDKDKDKEGKCGEGKCGDDKDKGEEGSCGDDKDEEGKCGDKGEEGSCGEDKGEEGKCGS